MGIIHRTKPTQKKCGALCTTLQCCGDLQAMLYRRRQGSRVPPVLRKGDFGMNEGPIHQIHFDIEDRVNLSQKKAWDIPFETYKMHSCCLQTNSMASINNLKKKVRRSMSISLSLIRVFCQKICYAHLACALAGQQGALVSPSSAQSCLSRLEGRPASPGSSGYWAAGTHHRQQQPAQLS